MNNEINFIKCNLIELLVVNFNKFTVYLIALNLDGSDGRADGEAMPLFSCTVSRYVCTPIC